MQCQLCPLALSPPTLMLHSSSLPPTRRRLIPELSFHAALIHDRTHLSPHQCGVGMRPCCLFCSVVAKLSSHSELCYPGCARACSCVCWAWLETRYGKVEHGAHAGLQLAAGLFGASFGGKSGKEFERTCAGTFARCYCPFVFVLVFGVWSLGASQPWRACLLLGGWFLGLLDEDRGLPHADSLVICSPSALLCQRQQRRPNRNPARPWEHVHV
jgi:hypothetical protein